MKSDRPACFGGCHPDWFGRIPRLLPYAAKVRRMEGGAFQNSKRLEIVSILDHEFHLQWGGPNHPL